YQRRQSPASGHERVLWLVAGVHRERSSSRVKRLQSREGLRPENSRAGCGRLHSRITKVPGINLRSQMQTQATDTEVSTQRLKREYGGNDRRGFGAQDRVAKRGRNPARLVKPR